MSPEKYVAEASLYVRYAETDAMGIVHHSSYIVYFEEGRSHYARQRGSDYAGIERSGIYLTVTEINARYIKPAVYGQLLTVRCWIGEMRSRGLTFEYEIVDAAAREVLVRGHSKHICITRDGTVTRIPETWRAWR
ncbi:MAG: acyl-CoA thioesterase [Anaerolineae bacterium]|nr:acyl-CoA thioesterase [Anaerolineae bacterium]NUQ02793.1 acyl-CoA thioesterase [Anaerolineae bacterium]